MEAGKSYQATSASQVQSHGAEVLVLATRWQRFAAMFVDAFTSGLLTLAVWYFAGLIRFPVESSPPFGDAVVMGLLGFLVFVTLNWYLMLRYGQTIGKRAMAIQVVDMTDEVPKLRTQLFLRYFPGYLMANVPVAGNIYSLADALLIFGKPRRCVHDYLAGTKVIKVT